MKRSGRPPLFGAPMSVSERQARHLAIKTAALGGSYTKAARRARVMSEARANVRTAEAINKANRDCRQAASRTLAAAWRMFIAARSAGRPIPEHEQRMIEMTCKRLAGL